MNSTLVDLKMVSLELAPQIDAQGSIPWACGLSERDRAVSRVFRVVISQNRNRFYDQENFVTGRCKVRFFGVRVAFVPDCPRLADVTKRQYFVFNVCLRGVGLRINEHRSFSGIGM